MFWRLYVQIEKRNAEEEKAGGVQVVDLLAFSTANTKKGKKSVLHTQQKKKEEKKRRACPFRSFTICVRVYMRCVCVSYCVQTLAETHPIYTISVRSTYATLTSACWLLLLPSRIFISMAYHIHFFYMLKHLRSFLFYFMHTQLAHTHWFSLICVFYYICCVCVVRLCLLSIRFPSVMCIVYSLCDVCIGYIRFNICEKEGKKSHVIFIYADGWLLLYYPFITPSSFHFSFDFCSFFPSVCVCTFILFHGP